jgi:uncharacterized repeat protein (TIGR03803 family)
MLIGALWFWTAQLSVLAQSTPFTVLHNFSVVTGDNYNWAQSLAPLVIMSNRLIGTAQLGGSAGYGAVFSVNTDGSGFTNLYDFTALSYLGDTNSDGASPWGVIMSSNKLYGVAEIGGPGAAGTIFSLDANGSNFTVLHAFGHDEGFPCPEIVLSSNSLYGTTEYGGLWGAGMVFRVNTDGSNFTNLHSFSATNGANPEMGLICSGTTLFGTTSSGGSNNVGTIFRINTDGSGVTNLYNFPVGVYANSIPPVLTVSGNALYGSYLSGLFKLNSDGSGFTNYFAFPNDPIAMVLAGNAIVGATLYGPEGSTSGAIFRIGIDGSGFADVYTFPVLTGETNSVGAQPAAILLSGNVLYGMTMAGGTGTGTVFALTLLPPLNIAPAGNQVVVSWPAWGANLTLQSATSLSGPWSSITNGITTDGTDYFCSTSISSPSAFFQLSQQ